MHANSFINTVKNALTIEAARKHLQPPFNVNDPSMLLRNQRPVPSFLNPKQEVAPQAQPIEPFQNQNNAPLNPIEPPKKFEKPIQDPVNEELSSNTFVPKNEQGYLALYSHLLNLELARIKNPILVSKEDVSDIFRSFIKEQKEKVVKEIMQGKIDEAIKDLKFGGLGLLEKRFNKLYSEWPGPSLDEDPDIVNESKNKYPDMSEEEIRAFYNFCVKQVQRASSRKGESRSAIAPQANKMVLNSNEIKDNENNYAIYTRMYEQELKNSLPISNLTGIDLVDANGNPVDVEKANAPARQSMAKLFKEFYLGNKSGLKPKSRNTRPGEETLEDRLNRFLGEDQKNQVAKKKKNDKFLDEDGFPIRSDESDLDEWENERNDVYDSDVPDYSSQNQPDNADSQGMDPLTFVDTELFQKDILNKENCLGFFLKRDMQSRLMSVIDKNPNHHDESVFKTNIIPKSGDLSYDQQVMSVLQDEGNVVNLFNELKSIITNINDPDHMKFFDWVLGQAYNWNAREIDMKHKMQIFSPTDNSPGKTKEDTMSENYFDLHGTDFRVSLDEETVNAIKEQYGLKKTAPDKRMGELASYQDFLSVKQNWQKISDLIDDLLVKMKESYEASDDKTYKASTLSKIALWSLKKNFGQQSMNSLMQNVPKEGRQLTDQRSLRIFNQNWNELVKQEEFEQLGWGLEYMQDDDIRKEAVTKAVQDGLFANPEEAFKSLFGTKFKSININGKCNSDIDVFKDILLNKEFLSQHSPEALVSFIDFLEPDSSIFLIGSLLSKTNIGTIDDKIDYLSELFRRGVPIESNGAMIQSEAEIEQMSPKDVFDIFDRVRETIIARLSSEGKIKEALGNENDTTITNQQLAEAANIAGYPHIKDKKSYQSLSPKDKLKIREVFIEVEAKKYSPISTSQSKALVSFLSRYITNSSNNPNWLQMNNFKDKNDFLHQIGIFDPLDIKKSLEDMPVRRYMQIAKHFYPRLYKAYEEGKLLKGKAESSEKNKQAIEEVVEELLQVQHEKAKWNQRYDLEECIFFSEVLDAKSLLERQNPAINASARYEAFRKIAAQRRANKVVVLQQRMSKFNADTSLLGLFDEIKYGRI